jgi:5-hydroxyisourate hydrolase
MPVEIICQAEFPSIHVGDFLRRQGSAHAGFLEVIVFGFVIARPEEHFHLPLKFTPWGYSLFRGS